MLLASAFLIVLMALTVSEDVISRKIFGVTWSLLYEIITYVLVWITFLGTTAILRAQTHVKMDSLSSRLPLKAQALLNFITSCACTLLLFGIVVYTVKLTLLDYQNHFMLASILNPVKWPIEMIIPIGFFMLFVQMIRNGYGFYKTYQTSYQQPAGQEITHADDKAIF